ncbi:MAG: respiratory nitrate reductase subunit gamma [Acidobacteriota bacterium]|nr:respiratory nitrate reductase subunit gamma [Acidobacteriota bacterium]
MQTLVFVVFPYVAVLLAIGVGVYRRRARAYTYSALSSQLLEGGRLFWGSVPWHYGITLILLAHLLAFLFPGVAGLILASPIRLFVAEAIGLALGFYSIFGLAILMVRRLPGQSRASAVSSTMDWVLLLFLAVQVATGVAVALFDRWGSLWFLSSAVPWLRSLVLLRPDAATVAGLPLLVQAHFVCGFVLVLLFPFSRLVHVVMLPAGYLWRPYQVVIWNRERRAHD